MAGRVKVSCAHCGSTNYYPINVSGKKVVCGRCKNILSRPGTVIEPDAPHVHDLFRNSSLPLLIDFHSPSCAPCQIMNPVVENLAKRRTGEVMVIRVNVDQHPELGASFGVKGVPTFIVMRKGNERGRTTGAMSETDFALWVASKI
ncbi:MAG: thioredoxin family protein [Candidatus Aminicenantes bacterium]